MNVFINILINNTYYISVELYLFLTIFMVNLHNSLTKQKEKQKEMKFNHYRLKDEILYLIDTFEPLFSNKPLILIH